MYYKNITKKRHVFGAITIHLIASAALHIKF